MKRKLTSIWPCLFLVAAFIVSFAACKNHRHVQEKRIVAQPAELDAVATDVIESTLEDAMENNGHLMDFQLKNVPLVQALYERNAYEPLWTEKGQWRKPATALLLFIQESRRYGLYPEDYFQNELTALRQRTADTARENKLDAALWGETDLLLSSAFVTLVKHLKTGRLQTDTADVKIDSLTGVAFFADQLQSFRNITDPVQWASALEPPHTGYKQLKDALSRFLTTADFKSYTYVNPKDSLGLRSTVIKRLSEDSIMVSAANDSFALATAVKQYQKQKGQKSDGKLSSAFIASLNQTGKSRFAQIAVTLDKYKLLPSLPDRYIWVNIPAYQLQLWDSGVLQLESKVVVGKPQTRTPQLTSAISDMITYPQWHIPQSIIAKEILPGLQKDPGYTLRKGYSLLDRDNNEVDPYTVDWSQYEKTIPYRVIQGSGDANALGVLKFNFPNKYSVYLHDTNQRYLFSREKRALSHGCVRVEAWEPLAYYILERDNVASTAAVPPDSLGLWLAMKEKHVIPVRKRVPLYIRYFSCEGTDGNVVFYDDVYGEDKALKEKFFSDK